MTSIARLSAWSAMLSVLILPSTAGAVDCTELPNPTIGVGGSASKPLLATVGAALAGAEDPLTVIYQSPGACFAITPYVDGTTITGTANYWDPDGTEQVCDLPLTGIVPDFGMSGVQGTLCEGVEEIPAGIGDFAGPVTSWSILVPQVSSQTSISAEAVYFVYGYGATLGQVSPWTIDAELYSRNATSAALIAVALGAGIPPAKFKGVDVKTNQAMISSLAMSVNPEAAIGFTSTEVADANRGSVRTLAFQATGQHCAYWPDSTPTGFDKANVRDGHYFLWSPYHFYVPVDGSGVIEHEATRKFVGYFTGAEPVPEEVPLLDIIIDNGTIPQCAMTVWRDTEIGPLYSLAPDAPCGCYYEALAAGSTSCTPCTDDSACGGDVPVCRHGYCEAY